MDLTPIKDYIGWIVGFLLLNGVAIVTGIISIIRSGKMLPKEMEEKDLDNKTKEVNLADKYEEIANRAAEKAIKIQDKYDDLDQRLKDVILKVDEQGDIIRKQGDIIKEQGDTIAKQGVIIAEQAEIIEELTCDLENNKLYNSMLIQQMKDAQMTPIGIETIPLKVYNKKSKNKKKVDDV